MATTYGWVTVAEADTYFATRIRASDWWTSGAEQEAALQTAYEQLIAHPELSLPTEATAAMKKAQYEQALFLLVDPGMDERTALKAQGVTQAGIVKEIYRTRDLHTLPISPYALVTLSDYSSTGALRIPTVERSTDG